MGKYNFARATDDTLNVRMGRETAESAWSAAYIKYSKKLLSLLKEAK